ncbi:transcription antiterminator [Sphaerochaeta pleomorpha str. Grapes]|uniref:Transcription antiterminator n=1 Tax=Sphaerochaeta pleomorpha (strain ATCC BAA-1885 / DSM 22778 / Grapes) TaxID=158190 RepID=G8QWW8_SPHPG|nr:transcription termination/antitermination NusG family protein [Sphaerochaeta pleomorpha]AEV29472.1 transcription antiterminator [Sphaerochaeta pleomorpha str. Grapes]
MNYYCVACRTGGEAKVRAHLNKFFTRELGDLNDVRVFFPMRKMFERRKGKQMVTDQPILPGYLMLSSAQSLDLMMIDVERIPGSYGFLRNIDKSICLKASDMEYAAWIMGNNGVIKPSKVIFNEGEPIKVTEGPLMNLHGNIVRIDHRGSRVLVEFDFAGVVRRVSMPVEFIGSDK